MGEKDCEYFQRRKRAHTLGTHRPAFWEDVKYPSEGKGSGRVSPRSLIFMSSGCLLFAKRMQCHEPTAPVHQHGSRERVWFGVLLSGKHEAGCFMGSFREERKEMRRGERRSSLQTPRDTSATQGMKETPSTRFQPSPPAETGTSSEWHSAAGHGDEPWLTAPKGAARCEAPRTQHLAPEPASPSQSGCRSLLR